MSARKEGSASILPPLSITAAERSDVTVNYEIKIIIHEREPDTLRRWSDMIMRGQMVAGATIE
jgi:hypothetical protein